MTIMDKCNWDGGLTNSSCVDTKSFGFPGPDAVTAWDFDRVLVGDATPGRDRYDVNGLEQHELGHAMDIGHGEVCDTVTEYWLEENPMDLDGGNCSGWNNDGDGISWREGGYTTDFDGTNQIVIMIEAARDHVKEWSCH